MPCGSQSLMENIAQFCIFVRDSIFLKKIKLTATSRANTILYGTPSLELKFVITTEQQYCRLTAMLTKSEQVTKKCLESGMKYSNY